MSFYFLLSFSVDVAMMMGKRVMARTAVFPKLLSAYYMPIFRDQTSKIAGKMKAAVFPTW
jgi:hypothetical protein